MGGGNGQKSNMARERNMEKMKAQKESQLETNEKAMTIQNAAAKEIGHTVRNSVNKIAAHIKKPPHRRSPSPLNWFPRKRLDSYLRRKIRLLQEGDGMSLSLAETLGNANPHYTRMAREKIAAREAANKAMEARKAAMIEASWCRILQAARISSGDAECKLEKAEQCAVDAFEEAKLMGVMMFDRPDCPRRPCEVQSLFSTTSEKSAFEVDREVAAAVRKALVKHANCSSSSNKAEFRDLLRKISQNPDDCVAAARDFSVASLQCEIDAGNEAESETCSSVVDNGTIDSGTVSECREDNGSSSSQDLVNRMVERLKVLQESDLKSLATIVATCGLNAALLDIQTSKDHTIQNDTERGSWKGSNVNQFSFECKRRKENASNIPSLDKFLVKHMSRLEREVLEARTSKKSNGFGWFDKQDSKNRPGQLGKVSSASPSTLDLGSILVKHVSKFEREINEAKNSCMEKPKGDLSVISESNPSIGGKPSTVHELVIEETVSNDEQCIQSMQLVRSSEEFKQPNAELDKFLLSIPGKAMEEIEHLECSLSEFKSLNAEDQTSMPEFREITNRNLNNSVCSKKTMSHAERAKLETLQSSSCQNEHEKDEFQQASLDSSLANPVHCSKIEKMWAVQDENMPPLRRMERQNVEKIVSLDKILPKHQSDLEKAKLAAAEEGGGFLLHKMASRADKMESLGDVLLKHQSKLENAKLKEIQNSPNFFKHVDSRREARERELQEAWGGLSLGNSLKPHLSRLEKDKAAWRKAEEEDQNRARGC